MKKIVFVSTALLAVLTACEDYNDQFNIGSQISDVKNTSIVLADQDYATIAGLQANKELALSKDPEGGSYVDALGEIASKKYFTTMIPAEEYIPAFLSSVYPNLDPGSRITVTANVYKEPSGYLSDFKSISTYDLTARDYQTVWGDYISASFLSPESVSKIPSLLAANVSDAEEGDMKVVNYAYSATEPSTGGGSVPVVYRQVTSVDAEGGVYVLVAQGSDGNYYPFGKLDDESKTYGYMYPAPITVTDGTIASSEGDDQAMTLISTANGYALQNAWGQYIYSTADYNSFNIQSSMPEAGGEWTFQSAAGGAFSVVNTTTGKTIKLNLYKESFSYGVYPESSFQGKVYYAGIGDESDGGFTPKDIALPEGSTYVWKFDTSYGYWKASAYVGGANQASESWLVSGSIDLSETTAPQLSFDGVCRYFSGAQTQFMTVWVSENYTGDVAAATWKELTVPYWADGSNWNMVNSGAIDLSAYKGKKVNVAFKYTSTTEAAPTWEVNNVVVNEKTDYWDLYLFKQMTEDGTETASTRASRAGVAANASALYVYQEGIWKLYTNDDAKVAVIDPTVYEALGSEAISAPETVLPAYLTIHYPYVTEGDRVAVVYNKAADTPTVVEYTYSGTWAPTLAYEPTNITFVREESQFVAQLSSYIDETFLGSEGGFTVQNVSMAGLNYVWQNTSTYGWKASAYYNNKNNPSESWLISPVINFAKAVAPEMIFDEAHRYLNSAQPEDYFGVKISTDYKGDVTTCTWETLPVTGWSDGQTWDFVTVNAIDLSAYVGQNVVIAFQYKSDDSAAPTWEIMNLKVREHQEESAE